MKFLMFTEQYQENEDIKKSLTVVKGGTLLAACKVVPVEQLQVPAGPCQDPDVRNHLSLYFSFLCSFLCYFRATLSQGSLWSGLKQGPTNCSTGRTGEGMWGEQEPIG